MIYCIYEIICLKSHIFVYNIMAKPIKITPVLKGRDAINFLNKLKDNKQPTSNSSIFSIRKEAEAFKALIKKK